jgi:DNA-binding NtrC family response regulator
VGRQEFREAKREVVERFEHAYLSDLLEQHGGNVTSASQQAGMLRSALQRLLRKHGLKSATFRKRRAALSRKSGSREIRSD